VLPGTHEPGRFANITGKQVVGLSPSAQSAMIFHDWPGNVRELDNALQISQAPINMVDKRLSIW
jgi:DNA-binding NtrC family response regulator